MYAGTFQLLPKTIQGHEGLGIVTKVGKLINYVKEGDYVATRGEPAFSDYYNCKPDTYVKVPELSPKYIIEPVACGINIARSFYSVSDPRAKILILGSGFLATVVYKTLNNLYANSFTVVGNANKDFWSKQEVTIATLDELKRKKFDFIIDLSDKPEYLNLNLHKENATIVLAAEKHPAAVTTFGNFLWNGVTIKFPSPRNPGFYNQMQFAVEMIKRGQLETDNLWTKEYDRETEAKKAFEEGLNRPKGYSRGYIRWTK